MAGWHCRLGGRVLQQTLRGSEGQGAQCAAVRGAAKGRTRLCVNSSTGTTACRNTERRAATRVMQNQAQRKHYTWRGKADSDKRSVLSHILIYTVDKITTRMNVHPKQKHTHRHRKQAYGYQRRKGRGREQVRNLGLTDTNTIHLKDQQGYSVKHTQLYSISCNNLSWNII